MCSTTGRRTGDEFKLMAVSIHKNEMISFTEEIESFIWLTAFYVTSYR